MVACSFFSFSAPSSFLFHFLQEYVPSSHNFFACFLTFHFHQFILRTSFTIILPAILCCQCSFSKGLWGNQKREYFFNAYHRLKKKKPIEFNKYSYRNRRIKPVEQKGKLRQVCIYVYGDIIWWLATWQRWYNHPIEKAHLYCRWCWRN